MQILFIMKNLKIAALTKTEVRSLLPEVRLRAGVALETSDSLYKSVLLNAALKSTKIMCVSVLIQRYSVCQSNT